MHPGFVTSLQAFVAREVAYVIEKLGYAYEMSGSTLSLFAAHGGERLKVIPECTGLYTTMIYLSIIGAYPARVGEKLIGIIIGIPAIHVLNLARMVFIALVLYHKPHLFVVFHGYLWQLGFVIFMLLLVIVWMWKVVSPRRATASP